MTTTAWRTGTPRDPAFEREWNTTLAGAPYAHFALRLDYLDWMHRLGAPQLAVHVTAGQERGVIAARRERGAWISGLPWRWQGAVACGTREPEAQLAADEAARLVGALSAHAQGARVRAHLPVAPRGAPGFRAGKTLLHRVDVADDALIAAMDKTKRSMIRRAQREGYAVIEANALEQFRGFARVQRETDARHGVAALDRDGDVPAPGERWREWELPWMWLLLAVRDGEVGSGFGFALGQGIVLESRAAASTAAALKSGAFVLLAFEAARRARERGYRYLNWGGDTFFKRDVSGTLARRIELHGWLAGGPAWALVNRSESLLHGARASASALAGALKAWRRSPA